MCARRRVHASHARTHAVKRTQALLDYIGLDESTEHVVFFKSASDVEDRLTVDKQLLSLVPSMRIHRHLADVHIYVFAHWVLDLLEAKPSLLSIR